MAVITASLAAIAHMHLATAMSAAQESRQQQFSAPHRPSDRGTLAGCIVGNHTLIPLELAPGDIALVPVLEQHIPFRLRATQAARDAFAAVHAAHLDHT